MAYPNFQRGEQPVVTYSNIVYYGPLDRTKENNLILKVCEETGGSGLVIEENTVYEIDCECYKQMLERKTKKKNCANPFQS